ncbi:hypothetical protein [Nocardia blacklockiae]|uniref:hypothetical protein n=1 Tax=Nocardia blacklockiae TaxID=480036 RepID=UPI0018935D51|nr:hypothetical protein [Nocardia blacklockiae]MBF6176051.1 hypothetical protein [Nocardia blacklockiae]
MNNRRLLLVLLISAVLVLAAVVTLAVTTQRNTTPSPAPTTTPFAAATAPPTGTRPPTTDLFGNRLEVTGDDSGTALPQDPASRPDPAAPTYLIAAPARLQWQHGWGGAALPVSGSDGPDRISDGVASGFARTPQGAALAACDAVARALAAPEGTWQAIVRGRYLGGGQPLIDRFARSRASTPSAAQYATVPDGIRVLPGYQSDFAVVEIAVRARNGYASSTWPMAWHDGDWRVRVPDDIESFWRTTTSLSTVHDFGQWKTA